MMKQTLAMISAMGMSLVACVDDGADVMLEGGDYQESALLAEQDTHTVPVSGVGVRGSDAPGILENCPTDSAPPADQIAAVTDSGSWGEGYAYSEEPRTFTVDFKFTPRRPNMYGGVLWTANVPDTQLDCVSSSLDMEVWSKSAATSCWSYEGATRVKGEWILSQSGLYACSLDSVHPQIQVPDDTALIKVRGTAQVGGVLQDVAVTAGWLDDSQP